MQKIELNDDERTRCEVWTRVTGYHRPVHTFNKGKQGEHEERVLFRESRIDGVLNQGCLTERTNRQSATHNQ